MVVFSLFSMNSCLTIASVFHLPCPASSKCGLPLGSFFYEFNNTMWAPTWRCVPYKNLISWKKALEYLPCYTRRICSIQAIAIFNFYICSKIWPCFLALLSSARLEHALVVFNKLNFMEIQFFPALWKPSETLLFIQKREKASYLPKSHPHSDVKKISHHVHTFHSVFSLTSCWASSLVKNAQTTLAWKFLWRILDLLQLWEISNTHPWNTVLESARCLFTLLRFFWQPLRRKTSIQYKKKERLYLIKWLLPRDVTFHKPHFFLLHVICSKFGLLK